MKQNKAKIAKVKELIKMVKKDFGFPKSYCREVAVGCISCDMAYLVAGLEQYRDNLEL